jgi:signal transduction histidine kinase
VAFVPVAVILLLDEQLSRATARDRIAEFSQRRLALAREVTHRIELYFTMLGTALEPGQKGVLVGVPIFETAAEGNPPSSAGNFAGLVGCIIKLDCLAQEFVAPIRPSDRGHAFLMDVERVLLAYAPVRIGKQPWAIGIWAPKEDALNLIRSAHHSDRTGPCELCPKKELLDADGEPTGVHVQEVENAATGRCYEVHCRAIRWVEGQMVGLLIAFDVTERRRQEQLTVEQGNRLQEQQAQLAASQEKLASATAHVSELVDTAAQEQALDMHYANPNLVACWRARSCQKTWCPCHGREPMRCWQVEGTFCDREKPATFAEKLIGCRSCEVFRKSCPDRLTELAEGFNNLMFLYSRKMEEMRHLRYHAIQRERMATIGQMAAGIAHEIGNPVASLFSLVHVLEASAQGEEARGNLTLMQQCIERISKIVREVVEFGRPIRSEDWTHGDVQKVVDDTLRLLRYDHRARNVAVSVDFEPELPKTLIIEHPLQQVFTNVMLNAFDAMHGRGTLAVRGWHTDGAIEVSIADTGEGMRPEQIQHVFEPFYTTKPARKGTGLGLALSYNIVQRHGGAIRVQSEVGTGSTFTVSIPLRKPNGAEHATSPDPDRR